MRMLFRVLLAVALLLSGIHPVFGAQDAPQREAVRAYVESIRDGGRLSIDGQTVSSQRVLPEVYKGRDYAPLWNNPAAVRQLIEVLEGIESDGLDSADYHLSAIQSLRAAGPGGDEPARLAGLDILMTDALVRLGYHLLTGKVDAEALDPHWNMGTTIGDLDSVVAMAEAVQTVRIPALIEHLRPDHPYYDRLRRGLARYRAIRAQGGWPTVPAGPALKPGMTDARVIAVRKRLAVTGELATTGTLSSRFDEPLEAAVKRFQKTHNIAADGVVGAATVQAMNVGVDARIDQIRANLERARWVLHDMPREAVLVDIAGYRVNFVRNGETVWSTRAQVGTPYRKTPVFRDRIRYVEVNPTWTVPPTILRKDILPKLKQDAGYLQQRDMQVLTHDGKPVDPATIDWSRYPETRFPYLLRQNPGPNNALGRIKFMFPNKYAVYLHDTPSRNLFERDQRAFSSGCIRIEDPFEFAELLLDDPQWTEARLKELVDTKQTSTVRLSEPVIVILLYWTVNAGEDGTLVFKDDVYARDPAVIAGLNAPFSFRETPVLEERDGLARHFRAP
jgi:murein L,D-transpeptidase YcbB/YkuD